MSSRRTEFMSLRDVREYLERGHQPGELWRGHLELCPVQWGRPCQCKYDQDGNLVERGMGWERDSGDAGGGQP